MGKTSDFTIRQRILTDANIKRDIIERCSKTRKSCKCQNDSKCYTAFGDALEAVDRVKQVSSIIPTIWYFYNQNCFTSFDRKSGQAIRLLICGSSWMKIRSWKGQLRSVLSTTQSMVPVFARASIRGRRASFLVFSIKWCEQLSQIPFIDAQLGRQCLSL